MPYTKPGQELEKFKAGTLHSGSAKGPVVTNRKQAIAIELSERRKAGFSTPPPRKQKRLGIIGR